MRKITTVVLTLLCTACASMVDQADEPREAREYRTGSNVPVRDRPAPTDVKTIDQSAIEDLRRHAGARSLGSP